MGCSLTDHTATQYDWLKQQQLIELLVSI